MAYSEEKETAERAIGLLLFDSASAARLDCSVYFGYLSLLQQGSPVRTAF